MLSRLSIFGANNAQSEGIKAQINLVQTQHSHLLNQDGKYIALPAGVVTFIWAINQASTLSLAIACGCAAAYSYFYLGRQQQVDALHREVTKLLDLYRECKRQGESSVDSETFQLMTTTLSNFVSGKGSQPDYLEKEGWHRLVHAIKTELNLFVYGLKTSTSVMPSLKLALK